MPEIKRRIIVMILLFLFIAAVSVFTILIDLRNINACRSQGWDTAYRDLASGKYYCANDGSKTGVITGVSVESVRAVGDSPGSSWMMRLTR